MDWSPLYISFTAAFYATLFSLLAGTFCAWGVTNLKGQLKAFCDCLCTLPLVLPPTVLGFFLLVIFGNKHFLGKFLTHVGMAVVFNQRATIVAATVVAFPLVYRTVRASFEQINTSIIYAAKTLGLSEWKIFYRLMVPLSLPGITAGAVLAFTRALGEFGATMMLAGDIPGKTETIPVAIWAATESGHMERAYLWVLIILTISFTTIMILNMLTTRSTHES